PLPLPLLPSTCPPHASSDAVAAKVTTTDGRGRARREDRAMGEGSYTNHAHHDPACFRADPRWPLPTRDALWHNARSSRRARGTTFEELERLATRAADERSAVSWEQMLVVDALAMERAHRLLREREVRGERDIRE